MDKELKIQEDFWDKWYRGSSSKRLELVRTLPLFSSNNKMIEEVWRIPVATLFNSYLESFSRYMNRYVW